MAGSRQGWIEAPYADTPAKLSDVFGLAVAAPGTRRDVRIVPGLAQRAPGRPDVMRGEETQLAGIASMAGGVDLLVCMPGTHCKWVEMTDGTVHGFTTWMTGELYSVLSQHSILRHAVGAAPNRVSSDDPVFQEWLDHGRVDPAGAVARLFRIRAATLLEGMQPDGAAAALSGLLIGSEIGAAKQQFGVLQNDVALVGSGPLGALYETALRHAGYSITVIDAEAAVRRGLLEAARSIFGGGAEWRARA
jgi:2-dehydro-3-deoxygalactonokinase